MTRIKIIFLRMMAMALPISAIAGLASCEGRKSSNMVPTGDTVEVVIQKPADRFKIAHDTIPTDI